MAEQQRAILRLTGPDVPQDTIEITEKGLKIGRLAANDLPLQHQKISRFHAEIKFSAEGLVITDLGSSNGSFVGDTQLVPDMPYVLSLGDGIRLGPFVLTVEEIITQPPAGAPLDVTIAAGVSRQDIEAALKEAEAIEEAARVAAERQAQEEAEAKAKAEAEQAAKEAEEAAKRKAEEEKVAQEAAAKAKAEADKAAKEAADKAKADAKKSSKKETATPPVVETPPEPAIEPAPETQGAQKTEPTGERPVAEKTPEPEVDVTLVKAEEKSEPLPEPTVVPSEEPVVEIEDKAEAGVEELGPPENEAPPEPAQPSKVETFKPSAPIIPPRVPLIALSNGHLPPAIPGIPVDVSSWLQYLPPIYQEDMFTGRFLLIFESIGAPIEWILDHFDFFFDPRYAPEEWLQWFGSWVDVVIPDNLPEERQRAIVTELAPLFLRRGTPQSLSRHLELVFDVIPDIKEPEKPPSTFEVILKLGKSGDTDDNRRLATRIIEAHRPAHTQFTLTIK